MIHVRKMHCGSKKGKFATLILSFLVAAFVLTAKPAQVNAFSCIPCPCECSCTIIQHAANQALIRAQHVITELYITNEFRRHQNWFVNDFFRRAVLPALMMFTEQMIYTGTQQLFGIGAFLDAKEQLERQLLFQEKTAEAHKDYHPDIGMCTIGTAANGLAAADRHKELASVILAKHMIDRQLGSFNSSGGEGPALDRKSRGQQFARRFCDRGDNNNTLASLCPAVPSEEHTNRDIDYGRTVGLQRTLFFNYGNVTNAAPETDDENIFALSSNLYGHKVFQRFPEALLHDTNDPNNEVEQLDAAHSYLDLRSVIAKRSVAQNSFGAIAGMKAAGSTESANTGNYIQAVFQQLGVSADSETRQMLGTRPSYYALLEVMSQKIYQDPEFFTNLYDKPTNVNRKNVAMQAINLMLDRETFRSELRQEALLAVLLEMEIIGYQGAIQNSLGTTTTQSAPY